MNAEQIRKLPRVWVEGPGPTDSRRETTLPQEAAKFIVLREIAAQLAEQNAMNQESLDRRKVEDERMAAFRDQSLAQAEAMRNVITAPRVMVAGEGPQHLGCFVLLPDGTYAMAIDGERGPGMVPIQPDEAQRIIAILSKPPEGKPQ